MNLRPTDIASTLAAPDPLRQIRRVRHELRRRSLTLAAVEVLSPGMRRLHFRSPDLRDFTSLSPDDHIKLFFQDGAGPAVMRDYTPRRFDNASETLVVDFAVHDAGPATAWALSAKLGDTLEIGGPRGSAIIPEAFDWLMLVGDETALPAIGRRLEELASTTVVKTVVVVDGAHDVQILETQACWEAKWISRDVSGHDDIANARDAIEHVLPTGGEGFVWIAGEAQFARALRAHMLEHRKHPATQMKAAGYWVRGGAGAHEPLD